MSMHRSLKGADKVAAKRNVLKRFERIEVLKGNGRWKEGDRGRGLPKTKPPPIVSTKPPLGARASRRPDLKPKLLLTKRKSNQANT